MDEAGGLVTLPRFFAPAYEVAVGEHFPAGDDQADTCPVKVA
jgi:hypothetical protein